MPADSRYTIIADGRNGVRLERDAIPQCRPTEALLRVRYSLVSAGTERHYVEQSARTGEVLRLGYCVVGTVIERGADVHGVAPGDTAIGMGWQIATHSDYVTVPKNLVCAVDAGIAPERALLATLGATAVHAADRAALRADDEVLVVGVGAVGLLVSMVAADRGCQVWAWDSDPDRRQPSLFWRELDPVSAAAERRGRITAIFLCIDGDITDLFEPLTALLDPAGNGASRSRIVNVGRVSGRIVLAPATGNIDVINASRCGAGYRNDAYHHGLTSVAVPDGEHTVDENLRRCLAIIAAQQQRLGALAYHVHTPAQAIARYNDPGFFPPGLNLIDHRTE